MTYIYYWVPSDMLIKRHVIGDGFGLLSIGLPIPQPDVVVPRRRQWVYWDLNTDECCFICGGTTKIPVYGKLKPVRSKMMFRGKEYTAIVQRLNNPKTEFDIYNDIKYVFLPDFEVIPWNKTWYRPWIERHEPRDIPFGVNKPKFCHEYSETKSSYFKRRRFREEDVLMAKVCEDNDNDTISYSVTDDGGWTKAKTRPDSFKRNWHFRNWKQRTKYRKQYEKNIRNHIDTMNESAVPTNLWFAEKSLIGNIDEHVNEFNSVIFTDIYKDGVDLRLITIHAFR